MYFLNKHDLRDKITDTDLKVVTGGIDALLDSAELKAMAEIDSYLRTTYDMPKSWAKKNAARNLLLIQYATIVLLYHLHARVSPGNVPQSRLYEYDAVLKTLKEMAAGNLFIDLVKRKDEPVPDEASKPQTYKWRSTPYENFGF